MRPTREQSLLDIAKVVSMRSTCSRLYVGAVIARDGRMLGSGYNGPPSGQAHCVHFENLDGYEDPGCKAAVHAEANAIAFAARYGSATQDAEMYVTHSPCVPCAQLIVQSGICRVVYSETYRITTGVEMLEGAGVKVDRA